jgi:hypothetical protein
MLLPGLYPDGPAVDWVATLGAMVMALTHMLATILMCHYIKHGLACELGTTGMIDLIEPVLAVIGFCALVVVFAWVARG